MKTAWINYSNLDGDTIALTWQANPVMSVLKKLQTLHPEKSRGSHILTISLPKTLNHLVKIDITIQRTFGNPSNRGIKIQKLRRKRAIIAKRKIQAGRFSRARQIKTPYHGKFGSSLNKHSNFSDVVIRSDGTFTINGISVDRPHLYYYDSSTNTTQSSGAYIFRYISIIIDIT